MMWWERCCECANVYVWPVVGFQYAILLCAKFRNVDVVNENEPEQTKANTLTACTMYGTRLHLKSKDI